MQTEVQLNLSRDQPVKGEEATMHHMRKKQNRRIWLENSIDQLVNSWTLRRIESVELAHSKLTVGC